MKTQTTNQIRELFQMIHAGGLKGTDAMHNLDDVQRRAKKSLPKMIYDFRNFTGLADGDDTMSHSAFINQHLINASADWEDLFWLRELWKGPLFVKGIITPEYARHAVDCGVEGIIVSNHGGRQLDGLPSSIRALIGISDAVGDDTDIILDGGVRRGSDVIKAIALGARAVMTGRSWIWGLAAAGQSGVERVQAILAEEIDQTIALLGCSRLEEVDRTLVDLPAWWESVSQDRYRL